MTLRFHTRFGQLELPADNVLTAVTALPGFEDLNQFALLSFPEHEPVRWLQAVDEPGVALPLVSPSKTPDGYREAALTEVGWNAPDVELLCVLSREPSGWVLNLAAPILIRPEARQLRQVVLKNPELWVSQPLAGLAC